MKPQRIDRIPIAQIRVINPRSRNRKTFRGIISNIESVGLKKPITVFRREMDRDGTQYDLVCGQGRMEAVAVLGGKRIPAIVTEAPLKKRYLMSLIENVARKRPPLSDLLREVRSLKARGYTNKVIAEKLGMGHTYVEGILRLLKCGEDRLVEQVEAGSLPLSIAIRIATAPGNQVQQALSEAYSSGDLRGAKLIAVQRLIAKRSADRRLSGVTAPQSPTATGKELAREYELQTEKQRVLVRRAALVHERLALLSVALKQLFSDRALAKVLRAEGLDTMPQEFASRLA